MKALCQDCKGKGGFLLYEPGLYNETCNTCKGTGEVEISFPIGRKYTRYDKVCNQCNGVAGGCFSGPGLPEPRISEHAICPICSSSDLRLEVAEVRG